MDQTVLQKADNKVSAAKAKLMEAHKALAEAESPYLKNSFMK